MPQLKQKHIEGYFKEYDIQNEEAKVELLPEITSMVHERNDLITQYEKEEKDYKKEQIKEDIEYLEDNIKQTFQEFVNKKKK